MQESFVEQGGSRIAYRRYGSGPHALVCFHGYGEQASAFDFLEHKIGSQYTVYAIDLPFHGQTDWKGGLDLRPDDLLHWVDACLGPGQPSFSLMGFSLGGRMALSLYARVPERVREMVLLAPDGLKMNFWYWLATQTRLGNRFFVLTMRQPGWFMGILHFMNRMRWINASIFKFVDYYIGNPDVRKQLYTRWKAFRHIKTSRKKLRRLIAQYHTPVKLVYGQHDRIIRPGPGEKLRKGLEQYCQLSLIASGHQVLHAKHAKDILQQLGHTN